MNPFFILMLLFGILIILFGFSYYRGKTSLLPAQYHGSLKKSYLKYLGKVTMSVGTVPIISALISCIPIFSDSLIPVIVLIVGVIIILIIASKRFPKNL